MVHTNMPSDPMYHFRLVRWGLEELAIAAIVHRMHEDGTVLPTRDQPMVVVATSDACDRGGVALENNNAGIFMGA